MSKTITESKIRSIIENIVIQVLSEDENTAQTLVKQAKQALNNPNFNRAAIMKQVEHPKSKGEEDTKRSEWAKKAKGTLPIHPEEAQQINAIAQGNGG